MRGKALVKSNPQSKVKISRVDTLISRTIRKSCAAGQAQTPIIYGIGSTGTRCGLILGHGCIS